MNNILVAELTSALFVGLEVHVGRYFRQGHLLVVNTLPTLGTRERLKCSLNVILTPLAVPTG